MYISNTKIHPIPFSRIGNSTTDSLCFHLFTYAKNTNIPDKAVATVARHRIVPTTECVAMLRQHYTDYSTVTGWTTNGLCWNITIKLTVNSV